MTLLYIKPDPAAIHAALDEAAQTKEAAIAAAAFRDLKSDTFAAAQKKAAFISDDGLRAATAMDKSGKALWLDTGLGICHGMAPDAPMVGLRFERTHVKMGRKPILTLLSRAEKVTASSAATLSLGLRGVRRYGFTEPSSLESLLTWPNG